MAFAPQQSHTMHIAHVLKLLKGSIATTMVSLPKILADRSSQRRSARRACFVGYPLPPTPARPIIRWRSCTNVKLSWHEHGCAAPWWQSGTALVPCLATRRRNR